jgi:hypothetical protein
MITSALLLVAGFASAASALPAPLTTPAADAGKVGAPTTVWVYFRDTRPLPCCVEDTALTARAVERRALRRMLPGLFDQRDVPVDPALAAAVVGTGARVNQTSRWLHAVSAWATPEQVRALAALPGVERVVPVRGGRAYSQDAVAGEIVDHALLPEDYGFAQAQLTQIDLVRLHQRGFAGAGMVIGVLDSGFHRVHQAFASAEHPLQVLAEWDFINHDGNTGIEPGDDSEQHKHGTWILGTMAAYMPGSLVGAAYEAAYVLAKTEDVTSETPIEEDNYVAGLEFIEAHGADVATSSLGYLDWYTQADFDGQTAVTTIAVNMATANGLVCLTAAGNEGNDSNPSTSTIMAPADAFDVIACAAVNSSGAPASFSSSGPTADGRVKPEIAARGVSTATINSTATTGFSGVSGTSLSTPLLAGAAACILQARPAFTVAGIRQALFATASRTAAGQGPDPLFVLGYGIARALPAAALGRSVADVNLDGAVNGQDLGLLLSEWGTARPVFGDLNGDGAVNGSDLGILLSNWTQG